MEQRLKTNLSDGQQRQGLGWGVQGSDCGGKVPRVHMLMFVCPCVVYQVSVAFSLFLLDWTNEMYKESSLCLFLSEF